MSDRVKARIAALMKMTRASGCTEAEALAAAEKAAALMREYGLSEADITIGQASVGHRSKGRGARDDLWSVVAHCTNTVCTFVHAPGERGAEVVFLGRDPGPEIAVYLVAVLNRAIDQGVADFRAGTFYRRRRTTSTRRAAVQDFTTGMVLRLSRRLIEIFADTIDMAAKVEAIVARDHRFADATDIAAPSRETRFDDALWSGWDAANRVNLAHGVGGVDAPHKRIGRI